MLSREPDLEPGVNFGIWVQMLVPGANTQKMWDEKTGRTMSQEFQMETYCESYGPKTILGLWDKNLVATGAYGGTYVHSGNRGHMLTSGFYFANAGSLWRGSNLGPISETCPM